MAGPPTLGEDARNPWNIEYDPEGSSSGSGVAVAAGLCAGALGTDTAGSIRFPASSNSIVGLVPTYGRVSRFGVIPLSSSMDHIGPMTRTVEDTALMLQIIAGYDPKDRITSKVPVPDYLSSMREGVGGIRVGVLNSYFDRSDVSVHPETLSAVKEGGRRPGGSGGRDERSGDSHYQSR